jgi:hypothetical protein
MNLLPCILHQNIPVFLSIGSRKRRIATLPLHQILRQKYLFSMIQMNIYQFCKTLSVRKERPARHVLFPHMFLSGRGSTAAGYACSAGGTAMILILVKYG